MIADMRFVSICLAALAGTALAAPVEPEFGFLPPGAVRPRGWLERRARAAADGYTGRMDAVDAEAAAWPWRLTGRTTKEVPFFEPGETMAFEVDLAARRPLPAGAQIEIERTGDDGRKDVKREPAVAGRTVRYETALAKPGFVRVLATLVDAQGRPIRRPDHYAGWCEGTYFAELGAGVRPEELQSVPEPGDFDAFFASERALLAKTPLKAQLTSHNNFAQFSAGYPRTDCNRWQLLSALLPYTCHPTLFHEYQ